MVNKLICVVSGDEDGMVESLGMLLDGGLSPRVSM